MHGRESENLPLCAPSCAENSSHAKHPEHANQGRLEVYAVAELGNDGGDDPHDDDCEVQNVPAITKVLAVTHSCRFWERTHRNIGGWFREEEHISKSIDFPFIVVPLLYRLLGHC